MAGIHDGRFDTVEGQAIAGKPRINSEVLNLKNMKKEPPKHAVREVEMEWDDYFSRTERIDGPEIEGFAPTIRELMQLVRFHIRDFIEIHWLAFVRGEEISKRVEDGIWSRLDKLRTLSREDDFKYAVELACWQFSDEVDANIWEVFLYGEEALRRDTALELCQKRRANSNRLSDELKKRIAEASQGQTQEIPPEVLLRMARSIRRVKEEKGETIH
jgi:hypothetical protein